MSPADQWQDVLSGFAPEDKQRAALQAGAEELLAKVRERPDALQTALDILERRLEAIHTETWSEIIGGLAYYLGDDAANLFTWVIQDPATRVTELEQQYPEGVGAFVGTLIARFGPEMDAAYAHWREYASDWRRMSREVLFDQVTGRFLIKLTILKYSGDEVVLEGPPDSFLAMARNLLILIQGIGSPEAFRSELVSEFVAELNTVQELLSAPEEEAGSETERSSPTRAT